MSDWFVYILRCSDNSVYTGVTTDIKRRVEEHNGLHGNKKGAKYTRVRQPVEVIYQEQVGSRVLATRREAVIKKLSKNKKEKLVLGTLADEFKKIPARHTCILRQKILRPDYSLSACKFPQDNHQSSAHFGAFVSARLVGIVSVFLEDEPESKLIEPDFINSWQIRAMATEEAFRGKGYAMALLKRLEDYVSKVDKVVRFDSNSNVLKSNLKNNGNKERSTLIWCNARSEAVGFYEKAAYKISGKEFEIEGVGPHFRMRKVVA